jgi:hypothetical protein
VTHSYWVSCHEVYCPIHHESGFTSFGMFTSVTLLFERVDRAITTLHSRHSKQVSECRRNWCPNVSRNHCPNSNRNRCPTNVGIRNHLSQLSITWIELIIATAWKCSLLRRTGPKSLSEPTRLGEIKNLTGLSLNLGKALTGQI